MYETPQLNRVGRSQDVILGYYPSGNDIDTNWCENMMEFADESDAAATDSALSS